MLNQALTSPSSVTGSHKQEQTGNDLPPNTADQRQRRHLPPIRPRLARLTAHHGVRDHDSRRFHTCLPPTGICQSFSQTSLSLIDYLSPLFYTLGSLCLIVPAPCLIKSFLPSLSILPSLIPQFHLSIKLSTFHPSIPSLTLVHHGNASP